MNDTIRDAEKTLADINTTVTQENSQPIRDGSFISFVPKLIQDLSPENISVEWIWNGYIAKGHTTLFSALWKVGKSTLIAQLLLAIQEGQKFAGQETMPCNVLIISEESETMWARRRDGLGLNSQCWILCRPIKKRLNYKEWIELLQKSANFCVKNSIELLVIDTLSGFWNVIDENDASQVNSALLPLNILLEKKIALLLVHHFRKSGGSEGTAARGSGALGSNADILIEFSRLNGQNPNDTQRELRAYSRFGEETPVENVIELVDDEYVCKGTRADVSKEDKLQAVLQILTDAEGQGFTVKEITDTWDTDEYGRKPTKRSIQNYISTLLFDVRVKQVGEKLIGKTKAPVYTVIDKYGRNESTNNARKEEEKKSDFEANNARKESDNSIEIDSDTTKELDAAAIHDVSGEQENLL